ncbi:MAG TPA: histidine kinase [Gemmatimonadota bacterium]|nr:histidine kinase [Gemmatimonadota bacterium]
MDPSPSSDSLGRVPWRGIAIAQLGWFAVVALLAGQRVGYWGSIGRPIEWTIVAIEMTVGLSWGLMLPAIVLVSLRWPLGRRPGAGSIHVGLWATAMAAEALVYVTVDGTLLHAIRWAPVAGLGFVDRVRNTMNGHYVSSIQFFGVIVGVTQAYVWHRLFEDRQLRAARLEAELARSQLQILRSELHPHFLFNALHAISTLMQRDVAAAETMLARLGDLLRTSLANGAAHEVSLGEELEFLERYLDIERTRFGERLAVSVDAAPDTLEGCVPRLLLQPLVENAITHGIAPRRGPGAVVVRARRRGGTLRIVVADDGLGAAALSRETSGIGLANTRRRLEGLYGREHRFQAAPAPGGGFRVSLQLPFHTEPLPVSGRDAP